MDRCSESREYSFMYNESNEQNLQIFKENLLQYFFYNTKTKNRVIKAIDNRGYLDDYFSLNVQKRAWYEIKYDNPDEDEAYQHYYNLLHRKINENGGIYKLLHSEEDGLNLFAYSTFKKGKVKIGKQEVKIFKYLKKKNILTDEEIEKITTFKKSDDAKFYLCISRNIIDYIFISTNQSFSSCMNMRGSYPYWLGLPSMVIDPNRFLVFVCKGKISKCSLKGYDFKHFKYLSRSWGLISIDDKFTFIRYYPSNAYNLSKNFGENYPLETDFTRSKYSFPCPYMEDGNTRALPYIETYGYRIINNDEIYYVGDGGHFGCSCDFSGVSNIEDLESFEDLEMDCCTCNNCGYRIHEDDTWYAYDEIYCECCFHDNFVTCYECNEAISRDYAVCVEEYDLCEFCADRNAFVCDHCGEHVFNENESDFELICKDCSDRFDICPDCERAVLIDNMTEVAGGVFVCESCIEKYSECDLCGELCVLGNDGLCGPCRTSVEVNIAYETSKTDETLQEFRRE